jgi:hypothetical protein
MAQHNKYQCRFVRNPNNLRLSKSLGVADHYPL